MCKSLASKHSVQYLRTEVKTTWYLTISISVIKSAVYKNVINFGCETKCIGAN